MTQLRGRIISHTVSSLFYFRLASLKNNLKQIRLISFFLQSFSLSIFLFFSLSLTSNGLYLPLKHYEEEGWKIVAKKGR